MPQVSRRTGLIVRTWTMQQRFEAAMRRSGGCTVKDGEWGRQHFGLVRHFTESTRHEMFLVYEASLNNTTLEEWVERNRPKGKLRGNELYLPQGVSILCLNGDFRDLRRENLYCFPTRGDRMRWQCYHDKARKNLCSLLPLKDNTEEIRELARKYSDSKRELLVS